MPIPGNREPGIGTQKARAGIRRNRESFAAAPSPSPRRRECTNVPKRTVSPSASASIPRSPAILESTRFPPKRLADSRGRKRSPASSPVQLPYFFAIRVSFVVEKRGRSENQGLDRACRARRRGAVPAQPQMIFHRLVPTIHDHHRHFSIRIYESRRDQ